MATQSIAQEGKERGILSRLERGLGYYAAHFQSIVPVREGRFLTPSKTTSRHYITDLTDESCTCEAGKYGRNCKHLFAASIEAEAPTFLDQHRATALFYALEAFNRADSVAGRYDAILAAEALYIPARMEYLRGVRGKVVEAMWRVHRHELERRAA